MSPARKESKEEQQFEAWCIEAQEHGLVELYKCQPRTFGLIEAKTVKVLKQLKTKSRLVDRHICRAHTYTPDFEIQLSEKGMELLASILEPSTLVKDYCLYQRIYIDTKGSFTIQHGQSQMFSCNRKLMYERHSIWVAKVVPAKFFMKTWCPERYRWKQNRKVPTPTKMGGMCRTAEEFIYAEKLHKGSLQ